MRKSIKKSIENALFLILLVFIHSQWKLLIDTVETISWGNYLFLLFLTIVFSIANTSDD